MQYDNRTHLACMINACKIRGNTMPNCTEAHQQDLYNEMKWKCSDLKCIRKPTRSRLSLRPLSWIFFQNSAGFWKIWLNFQLAIFFGWISADIFTADFPAEPNFLPRCMECRCGIGMRKLSVCLSICQTCGMWQNGRKICPDFYTIRKII